jgi:fatty acid desaturase
MKAFSLISDSFYTKKEQYSFIERLFVSLIRDERDLPFVKLTAVILLTMIPLGIFLYVPGIPTWLWWMVATVYFFLNNLYFKGPFGLMLHCTCHIKLYKFKYDKLNLILPWFVGLFFGQTPETYFSHHIGMHHIENNLEEDESSTMSYQRDSFGDFMKYFGSFMYRGLVDVSMYFSRKKREKLMVKIIRGEVLYFIMCVVLCMINWPATVVVFILPLVISRFIMMLGNWTQHSFIDAADPGNHYKNSITCINTKYNKKCWNDGYHISHHVKPTMHWTEHPNHFLDNLPKYTENKSIVFEGIGFLEVFIFLMRKRYDKLEHYFVNIDNQYASGEEVIALMKYRTKKIEDSVQ